MIKLSAWAFTQFILVDLQNGKLVRRISADARVGPHNFDILSIFTGILLGNGKAECRDVGAGTRISITQESDRKEYLLWLHSLIAGLGYCNSPNTI